MTVQIFERVAGDTGPPIEDTLYGIDDLTQATGVVAYLHRRRETTTAIVVTIVNAATNEISVPLTTWLPTVRPGDWKIKYRVTFVSADKWTWESGRPDVVRVAPDPAL